MQMMMNPVTQNLSFIKTETVESLATSGSTVSYLFSRPLWKSGLKTKRARGVGGYVETMLS